jgi:acetolactate synthase-1/2/3 large subunit
MRHGGQILADQLMRHGVTRVFSVPGESFLALLDGLHGSGIANIVCRHEGGAAMMAEATAKLTGRPGICCVTRGPGATNASAGIHVARQDSTPLILLVGQIETGHRDREAFQEVDYRAVFGGLAKWVAEIGDTARIPEYIARAFRVATSGRPGPVVLALPEDMLSARADVPDRPGPLPEARPDLGPAARAALDLLGGAARPMVVVGGPHWSAAAARDLGRFATARGLPVALGFRRQDYLDNRHPCYAGDLNVGVNPRLAARLREADTLLVIGSRLGDIETQGYTLLAPAGHGKRLIHVHPDPDEPGRVWETALAVTARAPDFVAALAAPDPAGPGWPAWSAAARADYEWWRRPVASPGAVKLEEVIAWLSDTLPEDAILTNGAGNYAAWLHRYFIYKRHGTQLAPTSGSMGYGFPAAVAASLEDPGRTVVCLAGDGCFQMTLNEMSTAVQHGACPVVIVVNNGRYGTIRMHQERHYPGRVSGTMLANPDFAALARAYGGHGETVRDGADFPAAFGRARASGTVAVIDLIVDEEALATALTLSGARAAGFAAQAAAAGDPP